MSQIDNFFFFFFTFSSCFSLNILQGEKLFKRVKLIKSPFELYKSIIFFPYMHSNKKKPFRKVNYILIYLILIQLFINNN
jgi:hypothetical protein